MSAQLKETEWTVEISASTEVRERVRWAIQSIGWLAILSLNGINRIWWVLLHSKLIREVGPGLRPEVIDHRRHTEVSLISLRKF
jgi:hypothetical protein